MLIVGVSISLVKVCFKHLVELNMLGRLFDKISFYVLLVFLVLLMLSLFRNYQKVREVEEQIENKEAEVQKIREEGENLVKRLEVAQSPEFIESQLRNKLGMAKEGEIVVILPPDEVLRKIAPKLEEEEEFLPDPNWKRWMKLFL